MTTSRWVLPMHAVNLQDCTRNVFVRGGGVSKSRWFGFFASTATVFMRHLQNPWIASTVSPKCDCHDVQSVDDFFCNQLVISFRSDAFEFETATGGAGGGMSARSTSISDVVDSIPIAVSQVGAGGSSGRSSSSGCKCSRMPKADCQLSLTRKCFANVRHRDCE